MTLACVALCVLVLAGALLHLAWRLVLAALIWAPSGALAIVAAWYAALWSGNVGLGVAVAIFAAAFVRFAILRLARSFALRSVALVVWSEGR